MTDIPTTEKEFRAWRLAQTFATPELAERAKLVENDMRMLKSLKPEFNPTTITLCEKNIASFMADYKNSIGHG